MILIAALALTAAPPAAPAPAVAETPVCAAGPFYDDAICFALAQQKAGRFAESAQSFERAAAAVPAGNPRAARALAAAGNMWIAAGQPGKAALALDRALAGTGLQAEQRGLALIDRARAAEAQNDLKSARRFVTEAIQSAAADPFTWYFSAALAIREGDLPTARLAINRALALAPNDPDVLFEAGHVAQAEGDKAKAREHWQKAIAADPKGKTGLVARQALAMLDVPLTVTAGTAPATPPSR